MYFNDFIVNHPIISMKTPFTSSSGELVGCYITVMAKFINTAGINYITLGVSKLSTVTHLHYDKQLDFQLSTFQLTENY